MATKNRRLYADGRAVGGFFGFIFSSLIQISSSSKAWPFLWTGHFFPLKSWAWRLFKRVFRCVRTLRPDMNNFHFFFRPVDKSMVVQNLSPAFHGRAADVGKVADKPGFAEVDVG